MTTFALVIAIAALLAATAALIGVLMIARIGPRQRLHSHVWGMWEDAPCLHSEYQSGKKVRFQVPGQKRECLGCGEREARQVIAPIPR